MSDTATWINFEALHATIMVHLKAYVIGSGSDHRVDPLREDLELAFPDTGPTMMSRLCNQNIDVVKQINASLDNPKASILVYESLYAGLLLALKLGAVVSKTPLSPNEPAVANVVASMHARLAEACDKVRNAWVFTEVGSSDNE